MVSEKYSFQEKLTSYHKVHEVIEVFIPEYCNALRGLRALSGK